MHLASAINSSYMNHEPQHYQNYNLRYPQYVPAQPAYHQSFHPGTTSYASPHFPLAQPNLFSSPTPPNVFTSRSAPPPVQSPSNLPLSFNLSLESGQLMQSPFRPDARNASVPHFVTEEKMLQSLETEPLVLCRKSSNAAALADGKWRPLSTLCGVDCSEDVKKVAERPRPPRQSYSKERVTAPPPDLPRGRLVSFSIQSG